MENNVVCTLKNRRNGPSQTTGRFFLIIFLTITLTMCNSCGISGATGTTGESDKNPQNSKEKITMQNQMPADFYPYMFEKIKKNSGLPGLSKVWGVAVPHHQLAADVIAQTLYQLRDNDYENIYILSPDHYDRGRTQISFVESPLKTATGTTLVSPENIETLKKMENTSNADDFIGFEHGIGTPLPFIVSLWPNAKITPILLRSDAQKNNLSQLMTFLEEKSLQPKTLIVESSDFSHYLTPEQAHQKDLGTINALKQDDPEKILKLTQPDNCDSLNILYVMKSLQTMKKGGLQIYLNKNSQDYTKEKVTSSTSYITFFLTE